MKIKSKVVTILLVLGLFLGGTFIVCAADYDVAQPNMKAALEALKDARMKLERAEHNKGGHREKAIMFIDKAIEQVKKGIEVGEKRK